MEENVTPCHAHMAKCRDWVMTIIFIQQCEKRKLVTVELTSKGLVANVVSIESANHKAKCVPLHFSSIFIFFFIVYYLLL